MLPCSWMADCSIVVIISTIIEIHRQTRGRTVADHQITSCALQFDVGARSETRRLHVCPSSRVALSLLYRRVKPADNGVSAGKTTSILAAILILRACIPIEISKILAHVHHILQTLVIEWSSIFIFSKWISISLILTIWSVPITADCLAHSVAFAIITLIINNLGREILIHLTGCAGMAGMLRSCSTLSPQAASSVLLNNLASLRYCFPLLFIVMSGMLQEILVVRVAYNAWKVGPLHWMPKAEILNEILINCFLPVFFILINIYVFLAQIFRIIKLFVKYLLLKIYNSHILNTWWIITATQRGSQASRHRLIILRIIDIALWWMKLGRARMCRLVLIEFAHELTEKSLSKQIILAPEKLVVFILLWISLLNWSCKIISFVWLFSLIPIRRLTFFISNSMAVLKDYLHKHFQAVDFDLVWIVLYVLVYLFNSLMHALNLFVELNHEGLEESWSVFKSLSLKRSGISGDIKEILINVVFFKCFLVIFGSLADVSIQVAAIDHLIILLYYQILKILLNE